jgi:hypothetical protein
MYVFIDRDPDNSYRIVSVRLLDKPPSRELENHEACFVGSGPPNDEPLDRYVPEIPADFEIFDMVYALPFEVVVKRATALVNSYSEPESDDSFDYWFAAVQSLASLSSIALAHVGHRERQEAMANFVLHEPVSDWLACDGDIRYRLDTLLADEDRKKYNRWVNQRLAAERSEKRSEKAA